VAVISRVTRDNFLSVTCSEILFKVLYSLVRVSLNNYLYFGIVYKSMKNFLKHPIALIVLILVVITGIFLLNQKETTVVSDPPEVATIQDSEPVVPELNILHESIALLWHTAYPRRDLSAIKGALPKLLQSTTNLVEAELPGILQDKQIAWEKGVKEFQFKVKELDKAANNNDLNTALSLVESIHTEYENLGNILRPKLAELESFHQELYKVYHYYLPEGDAGKIADAIPVMQERCASLEEVTLPAKYVDKQEQFNQAVQELKVALDEVVASPNSNPSVENLHTAYQAVEAILL